MSRTKTTKQGAIVDLVHIIHGMGLDSIDNYVECELEERFDSHYSKRGKLSDPKAAAQDARQFQEVTAADVAKHPAFKAMVEQLAKDVAKGARKQALEFQLSIQYDID